LSIPSGTNPDPLVYIPLKIRAVIIAEKTAITTADIVAATIIGLWTGQDRAMMMPARAHITARPGSDPG
jgi:hypothetical protein